MIDPGYDSTVLLFNCFLISLKKRGEEKMKIGSERGEARRYFCFTRDISFCLLDK